jgi:C-terminal processing protease CtpA/Prc
MSRTLATTTGWLVITLIATTGTPALAQSDCSVLGQNTFVRDVMVEFYLWYQEMPDVDPALFNSPEAYLEAVRFRPLDETFSYIADQAATEAYYSSSQFIGIGFSMKQTGDEEIRLSQVFPGSPASEVRMARGDYLVAVDGRSIPELIQTGQLGAALGPSQDGYRVEIEWKTRRGEQRIAKVTKRPVTIPTVSQTERIDVNGLPVGYLHFRNFVEPSVEALNRAFAEFKSRGVTDVILDLRYNGGGLVSVAQHLGGLIGGLTTNAKTFVEFIHNDKNTFRNQRVSFEYPEASLDLPRLVVITTRGSASASEMVVNALRPFIPVTIVGDRTYGKPVGQYGFDFCDKTLFPVAFKGVNSNGEGDYFGGIPADCPAGDDLNRPLGNAEEASLAEALNFLRTGACSTKSAALKSSWAERRIDQRVILMDGWRQMLNAW